MPRTPETPGKPARHRLQVLLNDDDLAAVNAHKGNQSASAYLRDMIRIHLGVHPDDHDFTQGEWVASRTVKGKKVDTYRCTRCVFTQEIEGNR